MILVTSLSPGKESCKVGLCGKIVYHAISPAYIKKEIEKLVLFTKEIEKLRYATPGALITGVSA